MAGGATTRFGQASGEAVLRAAFTARGVPCQSFSDWQRSPLAAPVVLVCGYPFTTLYQTPGKVEFVVCRDQAPSITIEVKHQGVSGSCDEKLAYVLLNAVYQWPTRHGILVLSGSHWSGSRGQAATSAMRRLAALAAPAGRQFDVMDMLQATNFVSAHF